MEVMESSHNKAKAESTHHLLILSVLLVIVVAFTGFIVYMQKNTETTTSAMVPKSEQTIPSNTDNSYVNPFPTNESYQNPFASDSSNAQTYVNPFE